MLTNEEARAIALEMDHSLDAFFAAPKEDKALIIKNYLDAQIGSEVDAEIKSFPGVPFISDSILEGVSDAVLDQVARLLAKKFFGGA